MQGPAREKEKREKERSELRDLVWKMEFLAGAIEVCSVVGGLVPQVPFRIGCASRGCIVYAKFCLSSRHFMSDSSNVNCKADVSFRKTFLARKIIRGMNGL